MLAVVAIFAGDRGAQRGARRFRRLERGGRAQARPGPSRGAGARRRAGRPRCASRSAAAATTSVTAGRRAPHERAARRRAWRAPTRTAPSSSAGAGWAGPARVVESPRRPLQRGWGHRVRARWSCSSRDACDAPDGSQATVARAASLPASRCWRPSIAAALLLMTITAVTTCVAGVVAAPALGWRRRWIADRAVRLVAERLARAAVLRRLLSAAPAPNRLIPPATCLAAVFPHARLAQNTPTARYVAADGDGVAPAGSFVTLLTEDGVQVTCVARFLAGPDGPPLGPDDLGGWDAACRGSSACLRLSVGSRVEAAVRRASRPRAVGAGRGASSRDLRRDGRCRHEAAPSGRGERACARGGFTLVECWSPPRSPARRARARPTAGCGTWRRWPARTDDRAQAGHARRRGVPRGGGRRSRLSPGRRATRRHGTLSRSLALVHDHAGRRGGGRAHRLGPGARRGVAQRVRHVPRRPHHAVRGRLRPGGRDAWSRARR